MSIGSASRLRRRRLLERRAHLLVVGGDSRDVLRVELLRDDRHRLRAVLAEALLPHLQLEGDVGGVLSGEVRDGRRLARAAGPMAVVAALDLPLGAADARELFAAFDEHRIAGLERREPGTQAPAIGGPRAAAAP